MSPPAPILRSSGIPAAQGLYDQRFEHDACGVNFVCHLRGHRSHDIVALGIGALCKLQHRGALGAEKNTGDGAGILLQVPGVIQDSRDLAGRRAAAIFYQTGLASLLPELFDARLCLVQVGKRGVPSPVLV